MNAIELSAGPIEYTDTGGPGPTVVLLHGLPMDASLWAGVTAELAPSHRCIVPTLPLGGHRHALHRSSSADLSLPAIAGLVAELLERLDLRDVTLVGNDTVRALRGIRAAPNLLVDAAEALADFDRPALVVWAAGDRVMPPEHGRRLAELLPHGRLVEVADSYTLIPLDQPAELARLVGEFVAATSAGTRR